MSVPLVSVCILTCNHVRYIGDCIMSAVSQSSDVSLEILVGDDCSDDGTSDIVHSLVQQFPGLIHHVRHQTRDAGKNYQFLIGLGPIPASTRSTSWMTAADPSGPVACAPVIVLSTRRALAISRIRLRGTVRSSPNVCAMKGVTILNRSSAVCAGRMRFRSAPSGFLSA